MSQDPTSIGRYQIQRVLGQGAMGTVYLAMDPLLKRLVAIKVVHAKGSDLQQTLERFQREAEISARLNHPNIVTVYDVGTDPALGPFMAMEFVDGTSLSKLIRIGLSVEAGLRLLVQGMGALQAAHEEGIVHRDIKPDNILVSRDGRFKLMDFGIARRDESHLTQAGMIFGTPSFTAPELLTGGEASSASDRYAFAVTAFEVVTGRLPFSGSSVGSTLYRIVHDPPTFPVGTRPYVEDVFRKALSKNPEQRFPSLVTFMAALVEALDLPEESKLKLLAYITGDQPFPPTQVMDRTVPEQRPITGAVDATEILQTPSPVADLGDGLPTLLSPQADVLPEESGAGITAGFSPRPEDGPAEASATQSVPAVEPQHQTLAMPVAPDAPEPAEAPVARATQPMTVAPSEPAASGPVSAPRPAAGAHRRLLWIGAAALLLLAGGGAAILLAGRGPTEVRIEVVPPGAKVLVDGALVGVAPMRLPVEKGAAPLVQVAQEGYVSQERRLAPGLEEVRFTLERKVLATNAVDVLTDPEGAEVLLDGESKGRTPLKGLPLPKEGTPRLELRMEGYESHSILVEPDMPFPEMITLTPLRRSRR